jgi:hypothetical protein
VVAVAAVLATPAQAGPPHVSDAPGGTDPFAGACVAARTTTARAKCYIKLLLADIERSHDPAREVPVLGARARAAGGFIAAACHSLMHTVGREYARRHHVTLATLQRYLPRSNDPGCSAGFGHGLIMYLGPQIVRAGPKGALRTCLRLVTRVRQYTCVHGLGHAYMRVYDEQLRYALPMCRELGKRQAPDCAQGAFHDYWISLSGADGTRQRAGVSTSPRTVCARQIRVFVMPCWYRTYLERPPKQRVTSAAGIRRVCDGLRGVQRAGCVAAASLTTARSEPFAQVRMCAQLGGADTVSCLRAVPVEDVDGWPTQQLRLIRMCGRLHGVARGGCYRWFGKALAVVTNGAFRARCRSLYTPSGRAACIEGARRFRGPLLTFA